MTQGRPGTGYIEHGPPELVDDLADLGPADLSTDMEVAGYRALLQTARLAVRHELPAVVVSIDALGRVAGLPFYELGAWLPPELCRARLVDEFAGLHEWCALPAGHEGDGQVHGYEGRALAW